MHTSFLTLGAVAVGALMLSPVSSADVNDPIGPVWFGSNFDETNGDKVIVGRQNTLHTVFESAGQVYHAMSVDGITWEEPMLIGGFAGARRPTIASDTDGTLVVAAIGGSNADGFGELSLARLAWGDDEWWMTHLTANAAEPDLVVRGGTVHVTWTNGVEALYFSYPTFTPPNEGAEGEVVRVFPCEGVKVSKPSITLARHDCVPTLYIGYMLEFDSKDYPCSDCWQDFNWVSPYVHSKVEGESWQGEFSDPANVWFPDSDAESVSFSINANYRSGDVFLAWSDANNGVERTKVAHTDGNGTWDIAQIYGDARKVHIAADKRSSSTSFRVAAVPRGPFQPEFFAPGAEYRTGTWDNSSPTWTFDTDLVDAQFGNSSIFHPQAVIWSRCTNPAYTEVKAVGQFDDGPHYELRSYRQSQNGCPNLPPAYGQLCPEDLIVLGTKVPAGLLIDTEDLGDFVSIDERTATFRLRGAQGSTQVRMRWNSGRVYSSGPGHILVDDANAEVTIQSTGSVIRYRLLPRVEAFWNPAVRY